MNLKIWILALAMAIMLLVMPVAAVEIHGAAFDQNKNRRLEWDAQNFTAFWYNLHTGKQSETLAINQPSDSLTAANSSDRNAYTRNDQ